MSVESLPDTIDLCVLVNGLNGGMSRGRTALFQISGEVNSDVKPRGLKSERSQKALFAFIISQFSAHPPSPPHSVFSISCPFSSTLCSFIQKKISPPPFPSLSNEIPIITKMRLSNNLVGILNFLTFVLSIPILAGGIWLAHKANTTVCEKFFEKPIVVLGVFLMVVSLLGLIGACFRVNWLLWLYLLVMFLLIVLLFCFTIFAFVVTNKGAGEALKDKGYKEYRLGDYSHWLQKRVNSTKNWKKIKSCLIDGKVCQSLTEENTTTLSQFYAKNLSPIQSGCCKPSNDCGFQYVTPTDWSNPSGTTTFNNSDCSLWSNDQSTLCFNCQSCKAGVLQNVKSNWKKVAIINIICLVFLVIVYSAGCCAFRNNREDNYRWKPYG